MMAVMAAAATTAFAQQDLVKQAQKLFDKGELENAAKTLEPALSNGTSEDKAEAYNLMSTIMYQVYMNQQAIAVENQVKKTNTPYDTLAMNSSIVKSFEAALKCDEFDRQPNEKGKTKIRFREANGKKFQVARAYTINSGMYYYNHKNFSEAIKAWKLYVDTPTDPLFTGLDMTKDPYRAEVAYYVGLASYTQKDYPTAVKYAKIAAEDSAKVKDANEILLFSQKDGAKTKEDSLAYLQTLKDFHAKYPSETRYFNLLMDYYNRPGRQADMLAWVNEEIAKDPNNKMTWALKGEAEMNSGKWDEAVASYKKAAEIDPTFVQVVFNSGVCLNSKAIDLKDKLADKKTGGLTAANAKKVTDILKESLTYLEKARKLDPNREKVNWAYPLYQIYYSLKDNAKAAEMEKLLNTK